MRPISVGPTALPSINLSSSLCLYLMSSLRHGKNKLASIFMTFRMDRVLRFGLNSQLLDLVLFGIFHAIPSVSLACP